MNFNVNSARRESNAFAAIAIAMFFGTSALAAGIFPASQGQQVAAVKPAFVAAPTASTRVVELPRMCIVTSRKTGDSRSFECDVNGVAVAPTYGGARIASN